MKQTLRRLALCALTLALALPALALAQLDPAQAGLTLDGTAQQLGAPESYGSSKITVAVPADNPVQDGVNPITGEAYDGAYQPVLVNIDSHQKFFRWLLCINFHYFQKSK